MPLPPPTSTTRWPRLTSIAVSARRALDQSNPSETAKPLYVETLADADRSRQPSTPPPFGTADLLAVYDHLIARWNSAAGGRIGAAVPRSAPQRFRPTAQLRFRIWPNGTTFRSMSTSSRRRPGISLARSDLAGGRWLASPTILASFCTAPREVDRLRPEFSPGFPGREKSEVAWRRARSRTCSSVLILKQGEEGVPVSVWRPSSAGRRRTPGCCRTRCSG